MAMSRDFRILPMTGVHAGTGKQRYHRAVPAGTHELHGVPETARETAPNHEYDGTNQPGTETSDQVGWGCSRMRNPSAGGLNPS